MIDRQLITSATPFRVHNGQLSLTTRDAPEFIDITEAVAAELALSGIVNGVAVVFSHHTTAAIKINESEPELLKDMTRFLQETVPIEREYHHNNFAVRTVNMTEDECPNAHSHCQHLLLGASESVPVIDGRLHLGRWQRIFLVELDRAKLRQVSIQILGA